MMSEHYSHDSSVGPVFDVANFSPFKSAWGAVLLLGGAVAIGLGAAYFWNPDWINSSPSEVWANAHQETKDLKQGHPRALLIGVSIAALFSLFCLAGSVSFAYSALSAGYYIRVGEGGLSVRVPNRFFASLQRDFSWSEIAKLTVVQEKQFGAMSQSSGNIGGELQLKTHDGFARDIRLDCFREDAWLIYERIEEAMNMRPAVLG